MPMIKRLILIDEFGSGTDPKIGGGIAEALLKKCRKSDVMVRYHPLL